MAGDENHHNGMVWDGLEWGDPLLIMCAGECINTLKSFSVKLVNSFHAILINKYRDICYILLTCVFFFLFHNPHAIRLVKIDLIHSCF